MYEGHQVAHHASYLAARESSANTTPRGAAVDHGHARAYEAGMVIAEGQLQVLDHHLLAPSSKANGIKTIEPTRKKMKYFREAHEKNA